MESTLHNLTSPQRRKLLKLFAATGLLAAVDDHEPCLLLQGGHIVVLCEINFHIRNAYDIAATTPREYYPHYHFPVRADVCPGKGQDKFNGFKPGER